MSDHCWRMGRSVGRTLYKDNKIVGLVDTPELAQQVVKAMNARGPNWKLYQAAMEALNFINDDANWDAKNISKLKEELRVALAGCIDGK